MGRRCVWEGDVRVRDLAGILQRGRLVYPFSQQDRAITNILFVVMVPDRVLTACYHRNECHHTLA